MFVTNVIKDSFIDYKGEQSLVVFTKGCNLDCDICYNKNVPPQFPENYTIQECIKKYITPMHTALVISGGEPTLYELAKVCKTIKQEHPSIKIKVFTNGQKPLRVYEALKYVDTWSVDYKTTGNYTFLGAGIREYEANLFKTLEILQNNSASFIVRLWKHPKNTKEIQDIMLKTLFTKFGSNINYEWVDILK